ncbi:MAG: hypothetical protein IJW00_02450 [Clostridia bacterium]|nr:hypothetical protein [Clostridia bacterium]
MKVIIMELCGKEAVALNRNGQFVRIRNLGYSVGQELMIPPEMLIRRSSTVRTVTKIAALAACFCLVLSAIFGILIVNSQPYGYVSVDVNPSIEYRLNRFDRVISVHAVNEDGEALIASIGTENLEGKDIGQALSLAINELSVQGYLNDEEAGMLICCSAGSEKASAALNEKLIACTKAAAVPEHVEIITTVTSSEVIEEAEKLGTTAGKLQLIKSIGDDVDIQEWINKNVTEIYDAVLERHPEQPTVPADPETTETEIPSPPETTEEPESSAQTDEEIATSESEAVTGQEPDVTHEADSETEKETETITETEPETSEDTNTFEENTWTETMPDTIPDTWPEEWPEPETDENGNVIVPEDKPWWWWLWELIFGKKDE